ncbi:hypothetical protein Tco_0974181 [Tanacetum coccineum]|uniref:Reverse transcriptase domain-containing protein n=1 Tax=Tanacetum coccineum TaxID=301880 RepID=A0ABQ5EAV4_9ASTR
MNYVLKAMQSLVEKLRQQEQATNLSTHTPEPSRRFNFIYDDDEDDDDDNDDEESTIPLNEIISQIPPSIAITPVLPTMEPKDSLNIGDEHLSTIPEKESDEAIKASVKDLALLVTHLSELNEDECLTQEGDILLLEKLLNNDISFSLSAKELHFEGLKVIKSYIPSDFDDDYYESKGDTIYLESFLINDTIPNLPPKMFFDHNLRSLKDEPDNNDLKSMVKDCMDYEDSRARGFVHRSLKLQSF